MMVRILERGDGACRGDLAVGRIETVECNYVAKIDADGQVPTFVEGAFRTDIKGISQRCSLGRRYGQAVATTLQLYYAPAASHTLINLDIGWIQCFCIHCQPSPDVKCSDGRVVFRVTFDSKWTHCHCTSFSRRYFRLTYFDSIRALLYMVAGGSCVMRS